MNKIAFRVLLLLISLLLVPQLAPGAGPVRLAPGEGLCPPLQPSVGNVVDVSTVSQLQAAVNSAVLNTTIRLADGVYALNGVYLRFDVPHVTLRSASGNRSAVVLDGDYVTTEIIQVVASDVTIADLTLREARHHPIHVMSTASADTLNTVIYNVHIIDPGQQAIKINPVSGGHYPDSGQIACSRIELTAAGRERVWDINGHCYTGGIDAHQARDWIVRDNSVEGFWCPKDLSEHAMHFWRGCRDTLVERNRLYDNARGIGFGLDTEGAARTYADDPCPGAPEGVIEHYGGLIRNNSISASSDSLFLSDAGFDCGICLWWACGAEVVHNSVASTQPPFSSIEWRYEHTDVDLLNNLASHHFLDRGGTARLEGNLENQPLTLFVDAPGGDLHLRSTATAALDQGSVLTPGLCDDDMDGNLRPQGVAPDVGADERELFFPRHWIYLPVILVGQ